jgi:multidrug efflux system membrane fusion protein
MAKNGPCFLSFAFLSLVLSGCREKPPQVSQAPAPVRVETVGLLTPQSGRRYSAAIAPYRQVTLSFRSGGFVDWLLELHGADGRMRPLVSGDKVRQGEGLARVRQKDYTLKISEAEGQLGAAQRTESAARAQLVQVEAVAAKASLDFTRANNLFATQSIIKSDYDNARTQRDAAQAQVEAARAQIDAAVERVHASEASLGEANLASSDTEIVAPFDGYVVQRVIETGALVATGSPAFMIADLSSVKAVFGLPDVEVAGLKTGTTLSLAAEALPGREFRGIVTAISPVADIATRLFPVEITIPNSGLALLAGMIVTVEARVSKPQPVLTVPLGAVIRGEEAGSFGVMVVEDTGREAHGSRRTITLGDTYGDRIQVESGLRSGERVVVSGAALLSNGSAVQVIP